MRRRVVAVWLSFAMISSVIVFIDVITDFTPSVEGSTTIYVNETGSGGAYTSIESAITVADDGDTVFVYNGTYEEDFRIDKTINLIGENMMNTTIDRLWGTIWVTKDWVNISGFTIKDLEKGIFIDHSSNIFINNVNFVNSGIFIDGDQLLHYNSHIIPTSNTANGNTILYYKNSSGINIDGTQVGQVILVNCTDIHLNNLNINRTTVGVEAAYSSNLIVENSNISNNWHGVYVVSSQNNTFKNNTLFSNNEFGVKHFYCNWNNITGNNVSDNYNGIVLENTENNNVTDNTVNSQEYYGIYLRYSSNSLVYDNFVIDETILLSFSSNNKILSNKFTDDGRIGISRSSSNNTVSENNGCHIGIGGPNNTIINNNNCWGIGLYSENNIIKYNNISNGSYGIFIYEASNNSIIGNNISSSDMYGIYLLTSSNMTIVGNSFYNDGIFIEGVKLANYNTHNITDDNKVNGDPLYYFKDSKDINITGEPVGQVILVNCTNMTFSNLTINNTDLGMEVAFSTNITIQNCTISSNTWGGVYLCFSSNIEVYNNTISHNEFGIYLNSSYNNKIFNNNISDNVGGISLHSEGMGLISTSHNNTISYNLISNSGGGVGIGYHSNHIIVEGNTFLNNQMALGLSGSSHNRIFHNNFIKSYWHPEVNVNEGTNNSFDDGYPSGGNFWDIYGGEDNLKGPAQNISGSDGIGDDPKYIKHPDIRDNYPLMAPFGNYSFLCEGWNLISFPTIQYESQLDKVLSSVQGSYSAVQWYNASDNNDPWKHYHTYKPASMNKMQNLDHTIGFWIHITEPGGALLEYFGTQPTSNQSIPLHPGWNMVGYPSLSSKNRTAALNNLEFGTEVDAVWTHNAATQKWEEVGEPDSFFLGKGYWIHATTDCVWEVPL